VNRGEVWWVEDPTTGRRPGVVLTRQEAVPVLRRVLVAPLTTTRRGIPTEVDLDLDDGVPTPCVVSLDNLRVVPKAMCTERLTTLSAQRMQQICTALAHATAC
jgi:mRNA interferase MazF